MKPRKWLLFIDETGKLENPEEAVAVVGVLLEEDLHPVFHRNLSAALAKVFVGVPYPPHAAELNRAAGLLASLLRAGSGARTHLPAELGPRLDVLAADLTRSPDPQIRAYIAAIEAKRSPTYEALQAAERLLRSAHHPDWLLLSCERDNASVRMAELFAELGRAYGPSRCFLVGAAEPAHAEESATADRYGRMLVALFERIYGLLRGSAPRKEAHEVRVLPASRYVEDLSFGRLPLHSRHIAAAIRTAERFPLRAPPEGQLDGEVRLLQLSPQRYDANAHPGLVLADFAANRLRTLLGGAGSWKRLARDVADRGLPPCEAVPRAYGEHGALPAMATTGAPREALSAALTGAAIVPLAGTGPGWRRDQAEAWIALAGALRAGGVL